MRELSLCRACPRLARHHDVVREQHPHYHAAPVGQWGDRHARLLIVGLAPGLHGATRTGQAFVGDSSGKTLFAALARSGWASHAEPEDAKLLRARITNVVKCLPPANRPDASEINQCQPWLQSELADFWSANIRTRRVVLCLGGVAYHATRKALALDKAVFSHGVMEQLDERRWLAASYHPSRQNVNTGRLTPEMLVEILAKIRRTLLID